MAAVVLLISSDIALERLIRRASDPLEVDLRIADSPENAEAALGTMTPTLIVCGSGHFSAVQDRWPAVGVVLQSESTGSDDAIEGIKRGALDVFSRPIDVRQLRRQIEESLRVAKDLRTPAVFEPGERGVGVDHIVGHSPAMKEVYWCRPRRASKHVGLRVPARTNLLAPAGRVAGAELQGGGQIARERAEPRK